MTNALEDFLSTVSFSGSEPFARDEHGLPVVIEDDPDDPEYGLPWSDPGARHGTWPGYRVPLGTNA